TTLMLSWAVDRASYTTLKRNGQVVGRFTTRMEQFQITGVDELTTLELAAFDEVAGTSTSVSLHAAHVGTEAEPNDTVQNAQPIDTGLFGEIDHPGDIDVFQLPAQMPGLLHIWAQDQYGALACLDTRLQLTGALEGDSTTQPVQDIHCADVT